MEDQIIEFLSEADQAALNLERSKRELELAKQKLELAKTAYDVILSKADELGVPRAKLKRLTEERISSLFDTGLAQMSPQDLVPKSQDSKPPKSKKTNRRNEELEEAQSEASRADDSDDSFSKENSSSLSH